MPWCPLRDQALAFSVSVPPIHLTYEIAAVEPRTLLLFESEPVSVLPGRISDPIFDLLTGGVLLFYGVFTHTRGSVDQR